MDSSSQGAIELLFYLIGGLAALLSFLAIFRLFSIETTLVQILRELQAQRPKEKAAGAAPGHNA